MGDVSPTARPVSAGGTVKTAAESPVKVAQAHGGAILSGGVPGNRGGSGRPANLVRARCRAAFDERIDVATQIADNPDARPQDRLAALMLLARFGGLLDTAYVAEDAERRRLRVIEREEQEVRNAQAFGFAF